MGDEHVELQFPSRGGERIWARIDDRGHATVRGDPPVVKEGERVICGDQSHEVLETTIDESGEMRLTLDPPITAGQDGS
mgnify:CR=1 FL=1